MGETVRFSLHAHESTASGDSGTPARVLAERYADEGFDLVGFVGHDDRPQINTSGFPIEAVTGVEREVETDPRRVHVVSFPEYDFSYLAHPKLSHPKRTYENAVQTAERYRVDGMEVYNRGKQHLSEDFPVNLAGLANDDAHNTFQVGSSFMEAEVPRKNAEEVFKAVKKGDVTYHNPGVGRRRYSAGRLHQALNLLR